MWIWIVATPVALVLVAYVAGFFLPAVYTATKTVTFEMSREELLRRMQDPERHPMCAAMCKRVEVLPRENGLGVWIEHMGSSSLRIRDVELDVAAGRVVRELTDTVVPFTARVELQVEEVGPDKSQVTFDNHVEIALGTWHVPLFRVTMTLFGGARSGIDGYSKSLRKA